jgi:hypothetical protein
MKTYARIDHSVVAELFATDAPIRELFHPSLRWVEVAGPDVAVGWLETAAGLVPAPEPPTAPETGAPTLAALQLQLAALTAEVAALAKTAQLPNPATGNAASA